MNTKEIDMTQSNTKIPTPQQQLALPFSDDLEYAQEELRWVEARSERLALQHEIQEEEKEKKGRSRRRPRFDMDDDSPRRMAQQLEKRIAHEERLRDHLDERLRVHRTSGAFTLALDQVVENHDLGALERMLILLAMAPCFSRSFEQLYGEISGEGYGTDLTVHVAFEFAELSMRERIIQRQIFAATAPLRADDILSVSLDGRYRSAQDLWAAEVALVPRMFSHLLGRAELDHELEEFSSFEDPCAVLSDVVLDPHDKSRILSVVDHHDRYLEIRKEWGFEERIQYGTGALMLFHGPPGTGKTMTAHAIAAHLGKKILNVDVPTFIEHRESERFLPGLFREARLRDALLFFDECELLMGSRRHGNALMTLLLTELERFDGVAVLATNLPEKLDEALARRVLVRVAFQAPGRAQREAIWRGLIPDTAKLAPDVDFSCLSRRYELCGGYLKNAVLMGLAAAVHESPDNPLLEMRHLDQAARDQISQLNEDGTQEKIPSLSLSDVVLSPANRREVENLLVSVDNRAMLVQQWGLGGPRKDEIGVVALFSGSPGTGKTLCAEAIAGELHRPLRRVQASMLLSKWVGETEKRVDHLFRQARAQQAVILIDEAEALLGARGAHQSSRLDERLVGLLLQKIETHPGLVLLATNLPEQLDEALFRRLTVHVEFERPDETSREALWRLMVPEASGHATDVDFERLARRYPLSGSEIRTAILRAATQALQEDRPMDGFSLERAAEAMGRVRSPTQPTLPLRGL
jgi:SpoVK/Ycf46/Vps4 family AAA+-type ATPase